MLVEDATGDAGAMDGEVADSSVWLLHRLTIKSDEGQTD